MTSYAPLFAHAEGWQWTPDLIWFDNLRSYATPNYYVQKLFSTNRGSKVLPMLTNNAPVTGQHGLYASAVIDNGTSEIILKLVNSSDKAQMADIALEGVNKLHQQGKMTVLKNSNLEVVNSLDNPRNIKPEDQAVSVKGKKFNVTLAPYSLSVVRVKIQ
jgi:alpha-L-arabinofuranosidase